MKAKIYFLAIKTMLASKSYTLINVLGLSLSLVCSTLIFRYVYSERSVDRFIQDTDRKFIVTVDGYNPSGYPMFQYFPNWGKEATFKDILQAPGIEFVSHFITKPDFQLIHNKERYTVQAIQADNHFLSFYNYPVLEGKVNLEHPENAVITERLARRLFGKNSPIGKLVSSTEKTYTVTAVIATPKEKTSLAVDLLLPLEDQHAPGQACVMLRPHIDYRKINKAYQDSFHFDYWNMDIRFQLYPLTGIYFSQNIVSPAFRTGNSNAVTILTLVGILLLVVGIINYINLYTIIARRRNKEFGMKRIFGTTGWQLFLQLLLENSVLTSIALLLSFSLTEILTPFVTHLFQLDRMTHTQTDVMLSAGLLLLFPLLVSIYPFFRYYYTAPVQSFRRVGPTGNLKGQNLFLFLQYTITFVMIVLSSFFIKQFNYLRHTDPGYRTKNIIKVPFVTEQGNADWKRVNQVLQQKLTNCPYIDLWTYGETPIHHSSETQSRGLFTYKAGEYKQVALLGTSANWLNIFGIRLSEGTGWGESKEENEAYHAIVSESAKKILGLTGNRMEIQPKDPIWQRLHLISFANPPYRVVGTVKDFATDHLSKQSLPIVMYYYDGAEDGNNGFFYQPVIASIAPGKKAEAVGYFKHLHDELIGGEFRYSFFEDEIEEMYHNDKQIAVIYTCFTWIAILISVLGLFGISLYEIQQRRKEIAIRKVNGALFGDIIRLLLKKYTLLLVCAFGISIPISLFVLSLYLENVAQKATVSWDLFALSFIITATVSLLTIGYQARKAAGTPPAEALKRE